MKGEPSRFATRRKQAHSTGGDHYRAQASLRGRLPPQHELRQEDASVTRAVRRGPRRSLRGQSACRRGRDTSRSRKLGCGSPSWLTFGPTPTRRLSGTLPALATAFRRAAGATRQTEATARKSQLWAPTFLSCLQSEPCGRASTALGLPQPGNGRASRLRDWRIDRSNEKRLRPSAGFPRVPQASLTIPRFAGFPHSPLAPLGHKLRLTSSSRDGKLP